MCYTNEIVNAKKNRVMALLMVAAIACHLAGKHAIPKSGKRGVVIASFYSRAEWRGNPRGFSVRACIATNPLTNNRPFSITDGSRAV
jgi:hypothetical protein